MNDIIHISDLFSTVVQRMRPANTITGALVQIGASTSWLLTTPEVYVTTEYNVRVDDWLDLYSAAGAKVGSYQVRAIDVTAKTFTIEINTAPTATPTTWRSQAPYYEHGHVLEVANTLSQKNKDETLKFQKYPLVMLVQDLKEKVGQESLTHSEPSVILYIVARTNKTYKAEQRKATTFTPILEPLYYKLLYEIHYSRLFKTLDHELIKQTKIDRLYFGKEGEFANTAGIFGDWLDAIEISDLDLKVKPTSYVPTNKLLTLK